MASNRKKIINTVFIVSLLSIIVYLVLRGRYINSLPKEFTIGEITDIYSSRSSSKTIKYTYVYKGVEFDNTIVDDRNYREILKKGECFIVSIPQDHESMGLLLKDYPTNGYCELGEVWDEIPSRFKAMKVE